MRSATRTDRNLLAFSLTAAAYFGFLALDYFVLRLDSVALGVVRELLTIPMILAVAVAFAVIRLLRDRRRVTVVNVGSAAILFALSCLVWI
ncbi:MAG: hypothetical protein OXC69_01370 [Candidatus Tectomicrobia bacterium]|nr:hypothetical protein [Candidatus Tectomicrobia bacterium]